MSTETETVIKASDWEELVWRELQMDAVERGFWTQHKIALEIEIGILEERFMPSDTGHLHTTVAQLKRRVLEIESRLSDGLRW